MVSMVSIVGKYFSFPDFIYGTFPGYLPYLPCLRTYLPILTSILPDWLWSQH